MLFNKANQLDARAHQKMTHSSVIKYVSVSCLAIVALNFAHLSYADDSSNFGSTFLDDIKYEASAPTRWDSQDWQNVGWAALAVVGTSAIADTAVRDFMRRQTQGNVFLDWYKISGEVGLLVSWAVFTPLVWWRKMIKQSMWVRT